MYREFISPSEEKKLEIFKLVCNTHGISLLKLSTLLQIPMKSLQKHIYFLNEDLNQLSIDVTLTKNSYHQYFIEIDSTNTQPYYSQLIYYYLLNSPQYQLVQYLITHNHSSMNQMCLDLHVSQSHMYRLMKKVNQILETFHLSIITNEKNIIEVAGKEIDIRIFIYSFLTQSAPSNLEVLPQNTPVEAQKFKEYFDFANLDQLTKNKLFAFWKTIMIRTSQKKFLPKIPQEYQPLLNFYSFLPKEVLSSFAIPLSTLDEEVAQAEYLYLNFFLHIFLPSVVDQEKIALMIETFHHSKKRLVRFFYHMIRDWQETFIPTLPERDFDQLLNSSLLFFNLTILIDVDLLDVWNLEYNLLTDDSFYHDDRTYTGIADLLKKHMSDYSHEDLDKAFFVEKQLPYLTQLLYLETRMNQTANVRIFVRTTIQYRTKKMIETRIRKIYSADSVSFVSDIEQADLIITDNYEEVPVTDKLLLLSSVLNTIEWEALLARINQTIVKKMFELDHSLIY
jgi:hypothetical protein